MSTNQRPHSQSAAPVRAERRKSPRTALHRPAYINFAPYNYGGVIKDISESGLRFHTVDALEQGGIVRVSILLGAASQIEAVGQLMWKDATCRVGGLRFTVLPAGAAAQIRNWAEASNDANPPSAVLSQASASPRTANSQEPPVNPDPLRPEAASPAENRASQSKSDANSSVSPQSVPQEAPSADTSTRSPWVPRSMRPNPITPGTQTRSQDSPLPAAPSSPQPWLPSAGYQQPSPMPWITHFDPEPPGGRWAFVRGVLGGLIIFLMLAGAGWFVSGHYAGNGGAFPFSNPLASHPAVSNPIAQPRLPSGELPDATNDLNQANSRPSDQSQPAPLPESSSRASSGVQPNTQPSPNAPPLPDLGSHAAPDSTAGTQESKGAQTSTLPQRTVAQAPSVAALPSDTLSATHGSQPAAPQPVAKAPATPPARAPDSGESQLTLAREYLDGRSRPRNPAAASQLLWSAVEKGNSVAELDLADLYLRGDGVARSCDQARILLSVASGKGNAEAMQKLSELNRTGCR